MISCQRQRFLIRSAYSSWDELLRMSVAQRQMLPDENAFSTTPVSMSFGGGCLSPFVILSTCVICVRGSTRKYYKIRTNTAVALSARHLPLDLRILMCAGNRSRCGHIGSSRYLLSCHSKSMVNTLDDTQHQLLVPLTNDSMRPSSSLTPLHNTSLVL